MATIPTKQTLEAAKLFAFEHDELEFYCIYKKEIVYYVHDLNEDKTYTGYPLFVIVDRECNCRYSNWEESLNIMKG